MTAEVAGILSPICGVFSFDYSQCSTAAYLREQLKEFADSDHAGERLSAEMTTEQDLAAIFVKSRLLISKLAQEALFCGEAEGLRRQRHATVEATSSSGLIVD